MLVVAIVVQMLPNVVSHAASQNDDVVQEITAVTVECAYEDNVNTAYFDAVTLCEGIYEATEYDENGNVESTSSSVGSGYSYEYSNNRVTKATRTKTGTKTTVSNALDIAEDYLGDGYTEASPGRFISNDGMRQVRMDAKDLASINNHAGAPHINFDVLWPRYRTYHVFLIDE